VTLCRRGEWSGQVARRRAGSYQAAGGSDAGSEPDQVGGQVVGGGVQCLIGHRVERVEDEQRRGGAVAQLGAACLLLAAVRDPRLLRGARIGPP
jgi:hypothetical protein